MPGLERRLLAESCPAGSWYHFRAVMGPSVDDDAPVSMQFDKYGMRRLAGLQLGGRCTGMHSLADLSMVMEGTGC